MYTEADEAAVSRAPGSGTISRRRVIQGAAWSAPVVLLATAAPAAAASGDPAGLVIASTSAVHNTASLTVNALASFSAGPGGSRQPVTGVTIAFSMPTARVGLLEPSTTSAGWRYLSTAVSGANTVFTFQWTGADLSPSTTVTGPLVATLPKGYANNAAFTVSAIAKGTSVGTAVSSPTATIPVPTGITAVFGSWMAVNNVTISNIGPVKAGQYNFQVQYNLYNDAAAFAGTGVQPYEFAQAPGAASWLIRMRFQIIDANGKVVDEDVASTTINQGATLSVQDRRFDISAPGPHRGRLIITSDQVVTVKGVNFALKSLDLTTAAVNIG